MAFVCEKTPTLTFGLTAKKYADRAGKRNTATMRQRLINIEGGVYSYAKLLDASGLSRKDFGDRVRYWKRKDMLTLENLGLKDKIERRRK